MPMEAGDWSNPDARAVTVAVGDGALLVNAWWEPLTFRLPADGPWSVELDTADPATRPVVADTVELTGRSLARLAVTAGRPLNGAPSEMGPGSR
jgi:pullulanase/glycogen debranching enzyme